MSYGKPDAAALAAAYAYGMLRNHPFADGNKRTAWVIARLFLTDNGYRLRFDPADAVRKMEGAAANTISESDLVPGENQQGQPGTIVARAGAAQKRSPPHKLVF